MKKSGGWILATLLLPAALTSLCSGARADTWEAYSNAKWGFKMLIVSSMSLDERVSVQGWTGCRATQAPVVILALTKVDTFLSEGDLKAAASGLTSVPESAWDKNEGINGNGWRSGGIYRASDGKNIVFGMLGQGAKGSYIFILKTTVAHFEANQNAYVKWAASIVLF